MSPEMIMVIGVVVYVVFMVVIGRWLFPVTSTSTDPTGPLVVRSGGRVIKAIDLTITAQIRGPYVINYHVTFHTSALDIRPGEDLRVYYDGVCRFSGHVQHVRADAFGLFLEVRADDLLTCNVPPIGWLCIRVRGHEGPCAAVQI